MEGFRAIFQGVEDPRKSNAKKHGLNEILVIALLATLAGKSSCSSFTRYAKVKYEFLSEFIIELKGGPSSHDSFSDLKPHRDRSEAVAACIRNCEANMDRMYCDLCGQRGLPVGSGIVESACKHIVGNRSKKSGCRRLKAGANALLTTGCCLENIRWPDFLEWRACRGAAALPKT